MVPVSEPRRALTGEIRGSRPAAVIEAEALLGATLRIACIVAGNQRPFMALNEETAHPYPRYAADESAIFDRYLTPHRSLKAGSPVNCAAG